MRKVDQAKHSERREHIMTAAIRCFERDGFRGASIADICAEARMSPGHLYHYFDSKNAIIKAITEMSLRVMASVFEQLAQESDLIDGLLRSVDRTDSGKYVRQSGLHVEMVAEATRNPAVGQIMREYYDASSDMLAQLLRKGQEQGQVDSAIDPRIAASILIATRDRLRQRLVLDPSFNAKQGLSMMKMLIARCLRPQPAPSAKRAMQGTGEGSLRRPTRSAARRLPANS